MEDVQKARKESEKLNESALAADLESRFVAVEKERSALQEKLIQQTKTITELKQEKTTLETSLASKHTEAKTAKDACQAHQDKATTLETTLTAKTERLNRQEEESDKLREEISRLMKANKELRDGMVELETRAKLNDSAAIPLRYEVERLEKQLESLGTHAGWLEGELTNRSNQMASLHAQHSSKTLGLVEELATARADRDVGLSRMSGLERSNQHLTAELDRLGNQLRQQGKLANEAAETADRELQAERRVVQLQKEQIARMSTRNEQREKELAWLRTAASKAAEESEKQMDDLRAEIEQEAQTVVKEQDENHQKQIEKLKKDLEEANRLRIEAEDGLLSTPQRKAQPLLTSGDQTLGMADLYAKFTATEDALKAERNEKTRLSLYLKRIEEEIAEKTPILQRQRKEYEWALQKQEETQNRLSRALEEVSICYQEAKDLREEIRVLQKRNKEYQQTSKELAKQVQGLLTSKAGGKAQAGVPTSVKEIQEQNQQLMAEHHRLMDRVAEMEDELRGDTKAARLEDAEKELKSLRSEREKQEEMVNKIVQQRDLYRSLLSSHESKTIDLAGTETSAAQRLEELKSQQSRIQSLEEQVAKTKAALIVAKGEAKSAEERVTRFTAHSSELTESIGKLHGQLSEANATAAREKVEATYHRDKLARAEISLKEASAETERIRGSKTSLQTQNNRLEQKLSETSSQISRLESELRQAESKVRLAETQAEASKAAETRLSVEVSQLRNELARQGALVDSVQRIEASLTAKNEEEKEKMKDENDRLNQVLDKERAQHSVQVENLQNRVGELEMEMKATEKKRDSAIEEATKAKGQVVTVSQKKQDLTAKCSSLESQLNAAKKELSESGTDELLRKSVETLTKDLKATQSDLDSSKERAKNFEKMAKQSEKELSDMTKSLQDVKKSRDKQVEGLKKELAALQKESSAKQEMIAELTKDLSVQQIEQNKATGELHAQIAAVKTETEKFKQDAKAAATKEAESRAEVDKHKSEAAKAKANYERELELHSAARSELRSVRDALQDEKHLRSTAEGKLATMDTDIAGKQKVLDEERQKFEESAKVTEKNLSEARLQNDLLHKQLESVVAQLEKKKAEQIESAAGDEKGTPEEVADLTKTISELREVVRYMRSEREMHDAQLDAARKTAERERAAAAVAKQSLEEARAELKVVQSKETPTTGKDPQAEMTEKLQKADEQMTLLRESNKMLRDEAKKLEGETASTNTQVGALKASLASIEKKNNDLIAGKAALEAEKNSLNRDLEAWKGRVQSLVSKFNQIDPDDHKKVLKELADLKKESESLKSQKEKAEKDSSGAKSLVVKLNKDLSQQKTLVEKHKALVTKLSAEKEAASKSSSATAAITKERDQLKGKVKKMETEAMSTQTELSGANQRIDMFKQRMRHFQKTINDQKKKINELESSAKPAPDAKPQEAAADTTVKSPPRPKSPAPRPKSPVPPKDVSKAPASEANKEPAKDADPPSESKTDTTAAAKTESTKDSTTQESKTLPTVPTGGFRYGPGGSRQPQPGTETLDAKGSTEGKKADDTATAEGQKTTEEKTPSGEQEKPATASSQATAQALKEKLLMKKRRLESLKRAEEEKSHKRALVDIPEEESPAAEEGKTPVAEESAESTQPPRPTKPEPAAETGQAKPEGAVATKTSEDPKSKSTEAAKPAPFGSAFAGRAFGTPAQPGFAKPTPVFASGTAPPATGFGAKKDTPSSSTSSVFLNMKPPSSDAAPLTFGKSGITLPTPAKGNQQPPSNPFGAFGGTAFVGQAPATQAKPLFGTAVKRAAPESLERAAKQPRVEQGDGEATGEAKEK